jgi:ribosomal protein S16
MVINISLKSSNRHKFFSYKIIVSCKKNNKFLDIDKIGLYNIKNNVVILNKHKLYYWLSVGATLSDRVIKLLNQLNQIPRIIKH